MPRITQEHIKDVYKKFKEYFELNNDDFFQRVPKHIVEDIKKIIKDENIFEWNDASLSDYINDLIYMLKGQQFARTINSFAEKYFIENICQDFDTQLCMNAKESLKLHKEYYSNIINKKNDTTLNKDEKYNMKTKNIMLYGAPGVGKTHNYKRLITMIEKGNSESEIFETIKKNHDSFSDEETFELIKKEKRVEFVTFHQSYSYEDFIEGFRPKKNEENSEVEIIRQDGIFKVIADNAKINLENSKKSEEELKIEKNILEKFKEYVANKIKKNKKLLLQRGEEFYFIKFENSKLYFSASEKSNTNREFILKYEDFKSIYNALLEAKEKITIQKISEILDTNSTQQKYAYYLQICEDFKRKYNSNISYNSEKIDSEEKNFYIVIDEINRGNISKIFGELITLIEEEKRDSYKLTLHYLKDTFKIP